MRTKDIVKKQQAKMRYIHVRLASAKLMTVPCNYADGQQNKCCSELMDQVTHIGVLRLVKCVHMKTSATT